RALARAPAAIVADLGEQVRGEVALFGAAVTARDAPQLAEAQGLLPRAVAGARGEELIAPGLRPASAAAGAREEPRGALVTLERVERSALEPPRLDRSA